MVFNRKDGFFLDLGSEDAKPARVAMREPEVETPAATQDTVKYASANGPAINYAAVNYAAVDYAAVKADTPAKPAPTGKSAAAFTVEAATAPKDSFTTAEAISAELRAAQEALPPPSNATFAPECLNPANAVASRRRLAGANLGGFKAMARGLFSS